MNATFQLGDFEVSAIKTIFRISVSGVSSRPAPSLQLGDVASGATSFGNQSVAGPGSAVSSTTNSFYLSTGGSTYSPGLTYLTGGCSNQTVTSGSTYSQVTSLTTIGICEGIVTSVPATT